MNIAAISVTSQGDDIAEVLKYELGADIFKRFDIKEIGFKNIVREIFLKYNGIIFISSTGIAVRASAPYLKSKDRDPAIIVVDSTSKFVISLISGHLGGANELTLKVSKILSAIPVITTATDNMEIEAPDMIAKNNKLVIDNLKDAKKIAALLVDRKKVAFIDFKNVIPVPDGYQGEVKNSNGLVYVTHDLNNDFDDCANRPILKLIRKDVVLGIGCKRNFDYSVMKKYVLKSLKEHNIDYRAVKIVSTAEIKKDENAILNLAGYLEAEFVTFSFKAIKKIQYKYNGSDFVEKSVGVRAVCEPCVELAGAKLITDKVKLNGMTLCIGIIEN